MTSRGGGGPPRPTVEAPQALLPESLRHFFPQGVIGMGDTKLVDAAASDDRLETLVALRQLLAQAIDECESKRDLAALSNRFQNVLEDIAHLRYGEVVHRPSRADEIAERRRQRRSGEDRTPLAEFQARVARKREEGM